MTFKDVVHSLLTTFLTASLGLVCEARANDGYEYIRHYIDGENSNYRLTVSAYTNGVWESTGVAEADLTTTRNNEIFHDRITWSRFVLSERSGSEQNLTEVARAVAPYLVSLAPGGSLRLPPLDPEQMTGMITDLHTFFVAVSPLVGNEIVQRVGDRFQGAPVIGNWGGRGSFVLGQDCIGKTIELMELTSSNASYRTSFLPSESCDGFQMPKPWMTESVVPGIKNNFVTVRRVNGKFVVMWGYEDFVVNSSIDRISGRIVGATMLNNLKLRMKTGCDETLENCSQFGPGISEVPVELMRNLQLDLQ